MKKILTCMLILLVCGILAVALGYGWLTMLYANQGNAQATDTQVMVEPGIGSYQIAVTLQEQQVIEFPEAFQLLATLQGKHAKFQAGEYQFPAHATPNQVIEKMATGDVVQYNVTVPEGYTSSQILTLLTNEASLEGNMPVGITEGSLLPETYRFTRGEERSALLKRMSEAQQKLLQKLWPERQDGLPFTTEQEALTLASIVEKETGIASERQRIAAVYINRLRINMPLQADPTVAYGLYGGQSEEKPLTYDDLKTDGPYNTYTRPGLPQGPICHPGRDSIAAVLNPLQTKELYFVATGDGGHAFAETHGQHLNNVAQYRKWQRQQKKSAPTE